MTAFDFQAQREAWERVPVDGISYFSAHELEAYSDSQLMAKIREMGKERYGGWRNHGGLWRSALGLDDTHDATVLDFGCGVGLEALQFVRAGNDVILADVNPATVQLAERVLRLSGYTPVERLTIGGEAPYLTPKRTVDVFYANGALHHTPQLPAIVARGKELLAPDGEIRLMLYTDRGWRLATGTDAPDGDPSVHPEFDRFVRFFDGVGSYSEPWWAEKLAARVDAQLVSWTYLTPDDRYAAAILR